MRICANCYSENSELNTVCFQCGGGLAAVVASGKTMAESSSGPTPEISAASIAGSKNTSSGTTEVTADETEIFKLLNAIERNTQMTERNLAATRSIAIFIVGWIGWFIVGLILILFGGALSVVPDIQALGLLMVVGGAIVILVGAVKAISNSLRELARSGS